MLQILKREKIVEETYTVCPECKKEAVDKSCNKYGVGPFKECDCGMWKRGFNGIGEEVFQLIKKKEDA